MKTKVMLGVCVLAIAILAYGTLGSGAWWSIATESHGSVAAATFDVEAGITEAEGYGCVLENLAPGDDPIVCEIKITNNSSIPINVLWSGFSLTDPNGLAQWIVLTDAADSNGQTGLDDFFYYGFDWNNNGEISLNEAAGALANGFYAMPDGNNSYSSVFVGADDEGYVSLTLAFDDDADESSIGDSLSFVWYLTAQQLPKNAIPEDYIN